MSRVTPPRLLTIAGSDSGGGAGIQADLKTFAAHGVYGMSVVTAVTAQSTRGVEAVHKVPEELVARQLDAVFEDIGVDAVKVGMLADAAIISVVAERLAAFRPAALVVDPVMVAKSGHRLLDGGAVDALRRDLLPLATLITPNIPEAEALVGFGIHDEDDQRQAAEAIAAAGGSVLVKGGHLTGEDLVDLLAHEGSFHRFSHRRLTSRSTHGTGCTLSSAIAARLGRGDDLVTAVGGSITYLQRAIAGAYPLGHGHGPVDHLFAIQGVA